MSTLNGPGEGTWSVFAEKVVEERDRLRGVCDLRLHIMERLEKERDEARAQLAAIDTGSPCDGHRHCCADRRKLAEELLRVRAERDEARERVLDAALIHAELVRERDEAQATADRLSMFYTGCELERRRFEDNLKDAVAQRDEAVHACAAALAERITWYQRGREEALKDKL